jgi:predicted porin
MRYFLLVPVVAAVLSTTPGFAAMDLYGAAHLSLDVVSNSDPDPANKKTALSVTSNHSHIGLRGREVISDALAVRWQFETIVDLDDGGWGEGRDNYIALESRYGTLLAGRHATPYRRMTERLDIFSETRADHSAVIGSIGGAPVFHQRARNILYYASPDSKRIRFDLGYIANQVDDNLPLARNDADEYGYSASLRFAHGRLYAGFAYEMLGRASVPDQRDAKARKAALGWDFGQGTQAALIWERAGSGDLIGGRELRREAWVVNLAHVAGNFTWKLAYGMLDDLDAGPDSGAYMVATGFSYALSPRIDLYLLAAGMINDDAASYGLQPYHDDHFAGDATPGDNRVSGAIPASGPGENVSVLSGGLIYRFDIGF